MSYSHADFKHCITIASTSRFWWRIVTDFFLALANSHLTYITRLCTLRAIVPCPPSLRTLCALIFCLRVRLHVTEMKSHPGMKRNLIQSLFFNKVAGWPATLLKKRHSHRCFPVNVPKFLRTPPLTNTSGGCLWHFQTWCYEKDQNRNYSTNLTTIKYDLNENNIDQW